MTRRFSTSAAAGSSGWDRRAFLQSLGLGGAVAALHGLGLETARGYQANDTLHIGIMGVGGRARALMSSLVKFPNVKITALCDVWDHSLEEGRKLADPNAFVTKSHDDFLARNDLDAVLIGSPDHWHVPMTIACCKAGKDVYVEKPLTHQPEEGAQLIAVHDQTKRVVQVGTQQRSMPQYIKANQLIRDGKIGQVFKAHLSWNRWVPNRMKRYDPGVDPASVDWKGFLGNAPEQPFDGYRFRNWRWFWDFGGGILTDLMVHQIDIAHWFLDLKEPQRAAAFGRKVAAEAWETPDTIECVLDYGPPLQTFFEGGFSNARNRAMITFIGTSGTIYLDRGRYEFTPADAETPTETLVLGTDPRKGLDFYDNPDGETLHIADWLDAIRTRRVPNAPVEAGVTAANAAHLGNQAYRSGQVAVMRSNPV